jgi:hypothetical protein
VVGVSNDLVDNSGSQQRMTAGDNVGMTWAMMWAMGTMAVMTPATAPAKGMVGMPVGRGGGLLVEDAVVAVATAAAMVMAAVAYCRSCMIFIVKIFLCGIFSVGGIDKVTPVSPPLTLLSCLRYVGILLGGDGYCPQKIVVCKYQK